jgi:hypothetical protein
LGFFTPPPPPPQPPQFVNKLWNALDCKESHKNATAAGFTTNPLTTSNVLDYQEVVAIAPTHPQILAAPKLVQYVRTNIVKQGLSFLAKQKLVDGQCKTNDGNSLVNIRGQAKFEKFCNRSATYSVDIIDFSVAVAAEAQLRIDFNGFMTSLGSEYHVVEYERVQADPEKEIRDLYAWMGVPHFEAGTNNTGFIKKAGEDLNAAIENIAELIGYIQELDLDEEECPLLRMLTTPHVEVFPACDYGAVVRSIQKSQFGTSREGQKRKNANKFFIRIVGSGGRSYKPQIHSNSSLSKSRSKVGPLNVTSIEVKMPRQF